MNAALVPELICSDIGTSLKFYCELLRFQILYDRPEEHFAYLGMGDAELMLEQPSTQDRLWPKVELVKPYGRGVNFEIRVDDVGAVHKRVRAAGLEFFLALEVRDYKRKSDTVRVRQFAVQDPDGYLIRLSQRLLVI